MEMNEKKNEEKKNQFNLSLMHRAQVNCQWFNWQQNDDNDDGDDRDAE